jgi:hypothetical protein
VWASIPQSEFRIPHWCRMYRAYGFLRPQTDFTPAAAADRLRQAFPQFGVTAAADRVTVSKGDWSLALRVNDGPEVPGEAAGLAGHIAGLEPAEAAALEQCSRRVEVWSDDPDPFVEHLADFQAVVRVLKSFAGLIAVDPVDRQLL